MPIVIAANRPLNAAMDMPDQGISLPKRPPKLQKIAANMIKSGPLNCVFMFDIITEKKGG